MKLHLDNPSSRNLVTGYGAGYVAINHRQYEANLILLPDRIVESWGSGGFEALAEERFRGGPSARAGDSPARHRNRQRFPAPSLLRPLIGRASATKSWTCPPPAAPSTS